MWELFCWSSLCGWGCSVVFLLSVFVACGFDLFGGMYVCVYMYVFRSFVVDIWFRVDMWCMCEGCRGCDVEYDGLEFFDDVDDGIVVFEVVLHVDAKEFVCLFDGAVVDMDVKL